MNKLLLSFSFVLVVSLHYLLFSFASFSKSEISDVPKEKNTSILLAKIEKPVKKQIIKEVKKPIVKKIEAKPKKKIVKKTPIKEVKPSISEEAKKQIISKEPIKESIEKIIETTDIKAKENVIKSKNEEKFKNEYISKLRKEIDKNKTYPTISRKLKEQGRVIVFFRVLKNGVFKDIKILTSSGKERLDKAALQALYTTKNYKPFLDASNKEYLDFNLPLIFRLN